MPLSRFLRSIPLLVLSACLGCVPDAHAAPGIVGPVVVDALSDTSAQRAGTLPTAAHADLRQPARGGQGRILFVVASSKVHGSSTLPASISFGEVVHAWDTFQAAGYAVDFVSPDGGDVPILDRYVGKDMEPRLKDERIMSGLRNTARPAQIDPTRYRAVYYVGGSNAIYGVPEHPVLQRIAVQVYERNGGVVSAVCHGTAGLVNLKLADGQYLLAGKRVTGYPEEHERQGEAYFKQFPFLMRKTVESRGGLFHALDGDKPYIEVDGRLVTGQNYASATQVAQAVVEILRRQAARPPVRGAKKA
ncbi:type 1 glutamine amidotransferase domain-containing protein [Lysobacter sp. BMK333-48F3]|uniref:type 1 glutamine amidotransferase domain-containing protein n=1 Tax=Lysobacter sp. BMK333-48F3 TaxID=2867962 RepID=UPI001C8BF2A9|nr:type 1 glutamine amidotransferase domain-containing protein [Lysobacter sp. BMK333-48F3]MBX9403446.1 type 1 glutamine amidotransferase domain-containing protein [Lysobacter sp. BMK333-48F3]